MWETDFLLHKAGTAYCNHCRAEYQVSPRGVIIFHQEKTEQNAYFDTMYRAGHSHAKDQFQEDYAGAFNKGMERAELYLKSCGFDMAKPLENLSILDAACGSGWVKAALLQNKNIINCNFHAFDISSDSPEMLVNFMMNIRSSNRLELSVQNAEAMKFNDATFDIIIGSSVLHHFDAFENFLSDCHRILKRGGIAIFGEPFTIGYGLGAIVLLMAQRQLGTHHQLIEDFYNDIAFRNKSPRELLKNLVDKHIFFRSTFIPLAQQVGFSSVKFVSPVPREYYRDHYIFIDVLLYERGISDARLGKQANSIYRIIFEIFDADNFVHSIAGFIHVILKYYNRSLSLPRRKGVNYQQVLIS